MHDSFKRRIPFSLKFPEIDRLAKDARTRNLSFTAPSSDDDCKTMVSALETDNCSVRANDESEIFADTLSLRCRSILSMLGTASGYKEGVRSAINEGGEYPEKFSEFEAAIRRIISSHEQVQSDWEETDTSAKSYIKNKPDLTRKADKAETGTTFNIAQDGQLLELIVKMAELLGITVNGLDESPQEWFGFSNEGGEATVDYLDGDGTNASNIVIPEQVNI